MTPARWQAVPPILAGLCALAVTIAGFGVAPQLPATHLFVVLHHPVVLACCLGAAWWVWRHPGCVGLPVVLAFALLFRIFAAQEPPSLSSDVYRYAWDGRVQRAGVSPYTFAPSDGHLQSLRDDDIHPHINRQDARTVYPPGAQVLFTALPYRIDGLRLAFILMDLLTIFLIARLLGDVHQDPARAVLYAWSPLAIYEIGNNGHLEAALLPFLLAAVLTRRAGKLRSAGAFLGVAASLKLYPLLLGLALAPPRWLRVLTPALGVLALLYGAYGLTAGANVLGFLPRYVGVAEDHNIGLRATFEWLLTPILTSHRREAAFALCLGVMAMGMALVARTGAEIHEKVRDLAGIYLLTVPTALHPWYVLWLLPWLCIAPRASWLWLVATVPLSYLKYTNSGGVMPAWVTPVEFLPTGALLAWETRRRLA